MAIKKGNSTTPSTEQQKQQQPAAMATASRGTTPPTNAGPTHEQISKRAYEIYLARGGQDGRHQDDWNQAERELKLGRQ